MDFQAEFDFVHGEKGTWTYLNVVPWHVTGLVFLIARFQSRAKLRVLEDL